MYWGLKVWKKRISLICQTFFFIHYYIDEILNDYELETLIRVKKDDYQQSVAYIKLISIYSHHASIDELQQQVDSIQMMMETYEDYHEFEQYLIRKMKNIKW